MSKTSLRVIGLISGTSVDGIDGVVATISGTGYDLQVDVVGGQTWPYPAAIRQQALAVGAGAPLSMAALAALDDAIATQFAHAANALVAQYGTVDLIGSHGQTVFHRPRSPASNLTQMALAYSLQLGRGDLIAVLTQCPTVSNFRQADIAAGGEGAPLVPPVDLALLSHPHRTRCVQNIGGIGNVAVLLPWTRQGTPPKVVGWDTGPGNSLIDLAVTAFSNGQQTYDRNGAWAAQGQPHSALVAQWLQHPYFAQPPPKSTGRELFGSDFLQQCLTDAAAVSLTTADILASLTELTAMAIAQSYRQFLPRLPDEVLLCGGGSHNAYLVHRLQTHLPTATVQSTTVAGVPADLKEAVAFAVLAYWQQQAFPGNLPSVTGAHQSVVLGHMDNPEPL